MWEIGKTNGTAANHTGVLRAMGGGGRQGTTAELSALPLLGEGGRVNFYPCSPMSNRNAKRHDGAAQEATVHDRKKKRKR
jgi:hypothetical protein